MSRAFDGTPCRITVEFLHLYTVARVDVDDIVDPIDDVNDRPPAVQMPCNMGYESSLDVGSQERHNVQFKEFQLALAGSLRDR